MSLEGAGMVGSGELTLDPSIRDWVLLPIVLVMVMVGIGRSLAQQLMRSETPADVDIMKHQNLLTRARRVRENGRFLAPASFQLRKDYFNQKKTGLLRRKVKAGAPNPMANPDGMMNMMKNNMTMMVPNILMMVWINFFFSGFILVKVPFGLTTGFKDMLQRGVELTTLDVSYVSSLSWYFLVMFGLRGFFALVLGSGNVITEERMMQAQMGMSGTGGPQQFDASKAYTTERESLALVEHEWTVGGSEDRLLGY